jgi:hypothetical protein
MINRIARRIARLFTTPAPRVIVQPVAVVLEPMQEDIVNYSEQAAIITPAEWVLFHRSGGDSYRTIQAKTGLSYRKVREICLAG